MSRARYPDEQGYIERDGVRVFYEAYGEGDPAIVFLPTWSSVHSRCWKLQIPYLARRQRVVVFDPRGNGKSDRPQEPEAYAESEFAKDTLDVMDATGAERAVLVGWSRGAQRALLAATTHPERVAGLVFVAPYFPVSPIGGLRLRLMAHPRARPLFTRPPLTTRGWAKFNAVHWQRDYEDFIDWFSALTTHEPHSTRLIEFGKEMMLETDPKTLSLTLMADDTVPVTRRDQLGIARRVRCPVLVIHGTKDRLTRFSDGRALAKATGGRLLPIEGGDHAIHARHAVEVNLAIRAFVESLEPVHGDAPVARETVV